MKVAFDTSALINLLDNNEWVEVVAQYFEQHEDNTLYVVLYVQEELDVEGLTEEQKLNYAHLEEAITHDDQRFFTLDVSLLDGSDVLRGDGAERLGIERVIVDKNSEYEKNKAEREAKGLPPKDIATWLKRNLNQNDSVIFERAERLGCEYVVSDNDDILRAKNSDCKPIGLVDFVAM